MSEKHEQSGAGSVQYINPDSLHKHPAFTNVVVVSGPVKTVYVGGQNAVDVSGNIIGKGDFAAQTEQVFKNLEAALDAGGAKLEHVIKWSIFVVEGNSPQVAFEVFRRVWGARSNPPAITVAFVSGLANPDFLLELEAIAVVPQ